MRAVFALAIHDKLRSDSPVDGTERKSADTPIRETPSPEIFRAIVAEIRAQVFSAEAKDSGNFVEFIGLAGLSQAEASSLRWKDIEWERKRIVTSGTKPLPASPCRFFHSSGRSSKNCAIAAAKGQEETPWCSR